MLCSLVVPEQDGPRGIGQVCCTSSLAGKLAKEMITIARLQAGTRFLPRCAAATQWRAEAGGLAAWDGCSPRTLSIRDGTCNNGHGSQASREAPVCASWGGFTTKGRSAGNQRSGQ